MSTKTGTLGLTIPNADGSDDVGLWPGILRQFGADLEADMFLATDAHVNADLATAYPFGLSIMPISSAGASSGGWPAPAGTVVTFVRKLNGVQGAQFYFNSTQGATYVRIGTSSVWLAWRPIAGPLLPTAMATGQVTGTPPAGGGTVAIPVTFPAGRFSSAPRVQLTPQSTLPGQVSVAVSDVTASSCTVYLYRENNTATSVVWTAVQGVDG